MNKGDYVSLEVAKLLKERGFDEECYLAIGVNFYEGRYIARSKNSQLPRDIYSKPSLYEAQKWLREKRSMEVSVAYCRNRASWYYWAGLLTCTDEEVKFGFNFQSYVKALNAGILEALKLI